VPDRACEMRINAGLEPTLRFCETPQRTIPARPDKRTCRHFTPGSSATRK